MKPKFSVGDIVRVMGLGDKEYKIVNVIAYDDDFYYGLEIGHSVLNYAEGQLFLVSKSEGEKTKATVVISTDTFFRWNVLTYTVEVESIGCLPEETEMMKLIQNTTASIAEASQNHVDKLYIKVTWDGTEEELAEVMKPPYFEVLEAALAWTVRYAGTTDEIY